METYQWSDPGLLLEPDAESPCPLSRDKDDPLQRHRAVVVLGRRAAVVPDAAILLQDAAVLLLDTLQADVCEMGDLAADGDVLHLRLLEQESLSSRGPQSVPADGSQSLAGFAIQAGHPVEVTDLKSESRFVDSLLRRAGVVSAIGIPLRIQNRVYGALAVCRTTAHAFSQGDVFFAEAVGHLVSATTARKQAEQELACQRRMVEGLLQTVEALVLTLDPLGHITRINRIGERLTGFTAAELSRRTIWSVFPVAREVDLYRNKLEEIRQGRESLEFESLLLTKHSQQKHFAWSWCGILDANGQLESILATGLDITRRCLAEERAERLAAAIAANGAGLELDEEEVVRFRSAMAGQAEDKSRLQIPDSPNGSDRRNRPRQSYPYHQLVAPMDRGELPGRDKFKHTPCHDISSGGFSFVSATPPTSDCFVVALGNPPDLIYLAAQVAHVTQIGRAHV